MIAVRHDKRFYQRTPASVLRSEERPSRGLQDVDRDEPHSIHRLHPAPCQRTPYTALNRDRPDRLARMLTEPWVKVPDTENGLLVAAALPARRSKPAS